MNVALVVGGEPYGNIGTCRTHFQVKLCGPRRRKIPTLPLTGESSFRDRQRRAPRLTILTLISSALSLPTNMLIR